MADPLHHKMYSGADIERYLQGRMTAKEMHALEKAALRDPFLSDAIEGYRMVNVEHLKNNLQQIKDAIRKETEPATITSMQTRSKAWFRVAAAIILIASAGIVSWLVWNKTSYIEPSHHLAKSERFQPLREDSSVAAEVESKKAIQGNETVPVEKSNSSLQKRKENLEKKRSAAEASAPQSDTGSSVINSASEKPDYIEKLLTMKSLAKPGNESVLQPDADSIIPEVVLKMNAKKGFNINFTGAETDSFPKPAGGWDSFQVYLYHQIIQRVDSASDKGPDILIQFSINPEQEPVNFLVLNKQDNETIAATIEAIKQGPRWTIASKNTSIRLRIQL